MSKTIDLNAMLPHYKVYTRIGVSKIEGVGVFAIIPIAKGTPIFEFGDEGDGVIVSVEMIEKLPLPIKKLYKDFGVLIRGKWYCVDNFNRMSSCYYLNHSKEPNVMPVENGDDVDFYAIRDIEAGEELTVDYSLYTDEEEWEGVGKLSVKADLIPNDLGGKGE